MSQAYDTVVGLEVHIQLNTLTKAFCGDALSFGAEPNTHVSAISLAHPGTLPVINRGQVRKAIQLGLALGCEINTLNFFDRKHYFYPDLPKGYQITQDNEPICIGGSLTIHVNGKAKEVKIHHIHMEEDAGKTIHDQDDNYSLVDLNRAGTPLLELVTEPDLSSAEEVYEFIAELQKLCRYIDVSDADMEKGSMRCDCNVSVKPAGSTTLGERCEIKNLNSKRFAREAVIYEAKRQIKLVEAGQTFSKQTLHYDVERNITQPLRDKEGVADYRYFPDPDLAPISISVEELKEIQDGMPEMPWEIKKDLQALKVHDDHINQIIASPELVAYFKEVHAQVGDARLSSSTITNQLLPQLHSSGTILQDFAVSQDHLVQFIQLIKDGKVTASIANQRLWPAMCEDVAKSPLVLAEDLGILINTDDSFLDDLIAQVINNNPDQVAQFKKGKKNLMGFFIGAVMRSSKGSADPKALQKKLVEALNG
jgi:aspartyl-tRNA(Asn)/glutamyl-tRNA(Gln) amidotransferase subunit B